MNLTDSQLDAVEKVFRWYEQEKTTKQIFRLFGYAGVGKTVLARYFAEDIGGKVLFAAYTGKAASVLRKAGCLGATTIHSLIYQPSQKSSEKLKELMELAAALPEESIERIELEQEAVRERKRLKQPHFELKAESELSEADLLIVDEVSMVDQKMGTDLLSFGRPILVLGDPGQLRPVAGTGFFTRDEPDVLLTEIHRQAEGNPILQLATRAREGKPIAYGDYGSAKVLDRKVKKHEVEAFDQMLCWRNITRRNLNFKARQLQGFMTPYPVQGDRLVCLRNNRDAGFLNGTIWYVAEKPLDEGETLTAWLKSDDDGSEVLARMYKHPFDGEDIPVWDKEIELFDYGYALTVHKAQGSQWDKVILFDEALTLPKKERRSWLYTGITRAAEELIIARVF